MGLDSVELVMDFEKEFDIEIPNATAEAMTTPRHVRDFVLSEYARLGRQADFEDGFDRIQAITARITALKPEKIGLDSHFVEDLGID